MFRMPSKKFMDPISISNEIEEMFDGFVKKYCAPGTSFRPEWSPPVDVSQKGDVAVVRIELPGVDPQELNISLRGDVLDIAGLKPKAGTECDENFHQTECGCGGFHRSIRLPFAVQGDQAEAVYDRGILTITLPRYRNPEGKVVVNVQ